MNSADLASALDPSDRTLRTLPEDVCELLVVLDAPARLAAHPRLVHDVAWRLTEVLAAAHPALASTRPRFAMEPPFTTSARSSMSRS